jgi:hypothetical protein
MSWPSVVGVADAWLFFGYLCSMPVEGTAVSQSRAPVDFRYAIIDILAPSSVAVVRNRWSPHTIGDECPSPGTVTRHFT